MESAFTFTPVPGAAERVKNRLPVPETCRYCGSKVKLVNNSFIYGKPIGKWPWAYMCVEQSCNSYVGLHPFTDIPLGTLANEALREARSAAKSAFNPLWIKDGPMKRSAAYAFLAQSLSIPQGQCHIGWMEVEQCKQAIMICRTEYARFKCSIHQRKKRANNEQEANTTGGVPDWYDERNHYLAPDVGTGTPRNSRKAHSVAQG